MKEQEDKFYSLHFICPHCEGTAITERSVNIWAYNTVRGFNKGFYGLLSDIDEGMGEELSYDESYPDEYSCDNCGFCIGTTTEEAFQWLLEHEMVKEKYE
jgi:hypothetical protein